MLNESSDIMWDTGPRNENGQGEIDKLGEKIIQQEEFILKINKIMHRNIQCF